MLLSREVRRFSQREINNLWRQFPRYAQPMPTAYEFLNGIPHKNDQPQNADVLWPVYRALHSTKMHYLTNMAKDLDGTVDGE